MDESREPSFAVSRLSDEALVEMFRSVKAPNNGNSKGRLTTTQGKAIESEMLRRGLMPDREDVIPDESAPDPDPEPLAGDVEDLPPGPGSPTGDNPEDDLPA